MSDIQENARKYEDWKKSFEVQNSANHHGLDALVRQDFGTQHPDAANYGMQHPDPVDFRIQPIRTTLCCCFQYFLLFFCHSLWCVCQICVDVEDDHFYWDAEFFCTKKKKVGGSYPR
eukprot:Trichotokara_eunicae@DN5524_c0_g1_i2.p1